jgi:hypothetical protein
LTKIQRIIRGCRFGIHDLSRVELAAANSLPRFNMPFEPGLDIAAKAFGCRRIAKGTGSIAPICSSSNTWRWRGNGS